MTGQDAETAARVRRLSEVASGEPRLVRVTADYGSIELTLEARPRRLRVKVGSTSRKATVFYGSLQRFWGWVAQT